MKFAVPEKEEEASVGRRRIVQTRFNAEVIQIDANPEEDEMGGLIQSSYRISNHVVFCGA